MIPPTNRARPGRTMFPGLLVLALVATAPASAATGSSDDGVPFDSSNPAAGDWSGVVGPDPSNGLVWALHIERTDDDRWSIHVPANPWGSPGPCVDVTIRGSTLAFAVPVGSSRHTVRATVSEDGQQLETTIDTAAEQPVRCTLLRTVFVRSLPTHVVYRGTLPSRFGGELILTMRVGKATATRWVAEIDLGAGEVSIIQGLPLVNVIATADSFRGDALTRRPVTIEGTLDEERSRFVGTFGRPPLVMPLEMTRVDAVEANATAETFTPPDSGSWWMRRHMGAQWALRDASVIDLRSGVVQKHVNILISGDVIQSISVDPLPSTVRGIDLDGAYVIPGLFDLHAHIQPFDLEAGPTAPSGAEILETLIAHGVTTVRALPLTSEYALAAAGATARGDVVGPRVVPSSAIFEMRPQRTGVGFGDAETARRWVEREAMLGSRWIKVYNAMDEASLSAIVEAAATHGMLVCGHTEDVSPAAASRLGIGTIEHVVSIPISCMTEGVPLNPDSGGLPERIAWRWAHVDPARRESLIDTLVAHGTGLVPTLVVMERILEGGSHDGLATTEGLDTSLQAAIEAGARFAVDLHRRGGRVGVGTDFPVDGVPVGASVHRELELLVKLGGATPLEALRMATIASAELLGMDAICGHLDAGAVADLLVLRDNPLASISNIRSIELVVHDGRIHRRSDAR